MGVVIVEGNGQFWGVNLGRPIVTNADFATRFCPNYFGLDLFSMDQDLARPIVHRQINASQNIKCLSTPIGCLPLS